MDCVCLWFSDGQVMSEYSFWVNLRKEKEIVPSNVDNQETMAAHLWLSLMKWTSLLTSPLGAADRRASAFITKSLALREERKSNISQT